MKILQWAFIVLVFAGLLVSPGQAQDVIVFPAQGQSNEQVEKDKFVEKELTRGESVNMALKKCTLRQFK